MNRQRVSSICMGICSFLTLVISATFAYISMQDYEPWSYPFDKLLYLALLGVFFLLLSLFLVEDVHRESYLSPRKEIALLDAIERGERLQRTDLRRVISGDHLKQQHGAKAISEPAERIGARRGSLTETRMIRPILHEMMIAAGSDLDHAVYIIDAQSINAAVWGGGSSGVHFALTAGALERLDRSGLEAVVANLLSRVPLLCGTTLDSLTVVQSYAELSHKTLIRRNNYEVDTFHADLTTTQSLRNPVAMLKVLFEAQKLGAALPEYKTGILHPSHFLISPADAGAVSREIRMRIERLHRMLEIKERLAEYV